MQKLKILYIVIILLLISSCSGTAGRIAFYHFNLPQPKVDSLIKEFLTKNTEFKPPSKYYKDFELQKKHDPYSDYTHIYFKDKEYIIYDVCFIYDSLEWLSSKSSTLAIVYVKQKNQIKKIREDKSYVFEEYKVLKQFEEEFLIKINLPYKRELYLEQDIAFYFLDLFYN